MSPKRKRGETGDRYVYLEWTGRFDALRKKLGLPVKIVAGAIWPHLDPEVARVTYYKKMNDRGSRFEVEEWSRGVDYLSEKSGLPLVGFPFVSLEVSSALGGRK